jgi:hypothetical protein
MQSVDNLCTKFMDWQETFIDIKTGFSILNHRYVGRLKSLSKEESEIVDAVIKNEKDIKNIDNSFYQLAIKNQQSLGSVSEKISDLCHEVLQMFNLQNYLSFPAEQVASLDLVVLDGRRRDVENCEAHCRSEDSILLSKVTWRVRKKSQ